MVELFRFIQQAFVVPAKEDSIDVALQSTFQEALRDLIEAGAEYRDVRKRAEQYFDPPSPGIAAIGGLSRLPKYQALRAALLALSGPTAAKVDRAVKDQFGVEARALVASEEFKGERTVTSDVPVAVKITTRFDKADGPAVTSMRQVVAFLEDFVGGRADPLSESRIRKLLDRPLRIPQEFMPPPPSSPRVDAAPAVNAAAVRREALAAEEAALRQAYNTLMSVRPQQLALGAGVSPEEPQRQAISTEAGQHSERAGAVPSVLGVSADTLASLDPLVREHLQEALGDASTASVIDVVEAIKRRWVAVSAELEPDGGAAPARVYRLGLRLFAVQEDLAVAADPPVPDFSHAITRPVGIGDLQVVRQELVGYEPAEISHIENVLPGELLNRTTSREETTELILIEETETTQSEERDTQSTQRNELATETQQEAGQQSSSTSDQTSTSNYGRLVENSKTNYARSVTDRAVNKVSQSVRRQRIQREKKVYSEKAVHQLDNSNGLRPIRGIYQWVDKKYKTKVVNYGKRLLYDVVIPEPAAFLIDSLKKAAQPENFQLKRPNEPQVKPTGIHAGNYTALAALYGVTGAVTPPPQEFITTFTSPGSGDVTKSADAYGEKYSLQTVTHFKIQIPENYTAVAGYIQRTNIIFAKPNDAEDRRLEFFIGKKEFVRFVKETSTDPLGTKTLNHSFTLDNETGEIPVTLTTFPYTLQFNYAIAINCRRTDSAYAQWQLKTHSQIVAGYQRQRAEYLDQLARYQQAVRVEMAATRGFSHDSTMERQELKKAFIHLLMSEHFGQVFYPAPDPVALPMNPLYVKKWGAVVAFFERAFEWEHLMFIYYPYFWGTKAKWGELIAIQDLDPEFEAFLKAGAARVVIPVRPGFEAALAHFHETGDVWMGEEIPDMFSSQYVTIIAEIKARNAEPEDEVCVAEWDVRLPTTLVMLKEDADLPEWTPTSCRPTAEAIES